MHNISGKPKETLADAAATSPTHADAEEEAEQDRGLPRRQGGAGRSPPLKTIRTLHRHRHCHRLRPPPPTRPTQRPTPHLLHPPTHRPSPPLQTLAASPMEVEVKLRLPDAAAHQSLSDLLAPYHRRTLLQENVFFDGDRADLSSRLAVLRLRFYGPDPPSSCVVSLKARASIVDGVSRVEEDEEPLDPALARPCVAEPWRLASLPGSSILDRVRREFARPDGGDLGFVCLGGFRNVRAVYEWAGLTLELDETQYDFGTTYEMECESSEPERVKQLLEDLLTENGIPYEYSKVSKFAIFRSGKLPE